MEAGPAAAAAVGSLVEALKDEEREVREYAARALGAIGAPAREAIPALLEALSDESREVSGVSGVLPKLGTAAVSPLIDALSSDNARVRELSAQALGLIGWKAEAATPALLELMGDEDRGVRRSAARALKEIKPDVTATSLFEEDNYAQAALFHEEVLRLTGVDRETIKADANVLYNHGIPYRLLHLAACYAAMSEREESESRRSEWAEKCLETTEWLAINQSLLSAETRWRTNADLFDRPSADLIRIALVAFDACGRDGVVFEAKAPHLSELLSPFAFGTGAGGEGAMEAVVVRDRYRHDRLVFAYVHREGALRRLRCPCPWRGDPLEEGAEVSLEDIDEDGFLDVVVRWPTYKREQYDLDGRYVGFAEVDETSILTVAEGEVEVMRNLFTVSRNVVGVPEGSQSREPERRIPPVRPTPQERVYGILGDDPAIQAAADDCATLLGMGKEAVGSLASHLVPENEYAWQVSAEVLGRMADTDTLLRRAQCGSLSGRIVDDIAKGDILGWWQCSNIRRSLEKLLSAMGVDEEGGEGEREVPLDGRLGNVFLTLGRCWAKVAQSEEYAASRGELEEKALRAYERHSRYTCLLERAGWRTPNQRYFWPRVLGMDPAYYIPVLWTALRVCGDPERFESEAPHLYRDFSPFAVPPSGWEGDRIRAVLLHNKASDLRSIAIFVRDGEGMRRLEYHPEHPGGLVVPSTITLEDYDGDGELEIVCVSSGLLKKTDDARGYVVGSNPATMTIVYKVRGEEVFILDSKSRFEKDDEDAARGAADSVSTMAASPESVEPAPPAAVSQPDPIIRGLGGQLTIRVAAPSWEALLEKTKPSFLIDEYLMLWIQSDEDGRPKFALDRAFVYQPEGEEPAWILLGFQAAPHDEWYSQVKSYHVRGVARLHGKIPRSDHGAGNYAVVLSEHPVFGKVYEVGWQAQMSGGTSLAESESRFYLLESPSGEWRFVGRGPGPGRGKSGYTEVHTTHVVREVSWMDSPEAPVRIAFRVRHCQHEWITSDERAIRDGPSEWRPRRDLTAYTDFVLEGELPATRRRTTEKPYMIAAQGDTLESIAGFLTVWGIGAVRIPNAQQRWVERLRELNPALFEGEIPRGAKVWVPRTYPRVPRDNGDH